MSARLPLHSVPLLFVALILAPAASWAGPWLLGPGDFHTEFRGARFSTETYYDDAGTRRAIGGTYEARSIVASTELGWKKRLSVRFDMPFRSVTNHRDPDLSFTQTSLSDLLLGAKLNLMNGSTALALEADWKAPLGYDRKLQAAVGDGVQDAIGWLHLGTALPGLRGFVQVSGGYRYRIERYDDPAKPKDEILAAADAGFWLGPSLLVAGNYEGRIESSDAAFPAKLHQAGPRILYRVDANLDVIAGSLHTFSGENEMHRNQYYVAIATKKSGLNRLQGFLGGTRRP